MDKNETIEQLRGIIGEYLKGQGLDLVDLILRREGKDLALRIFTDRPEGGITIGECSQLNSRIANILDEKGILEDRYILEVSSPGLDRPLREKGDFLRCLNRDARFFLNEPVEGRIELAGLITKVEGESVYIESDNKVIEIPLAKINKAKQVIE